MYADGEGVIEDDALAAEWFRKAAEQGDASAQYNLGTRYALGEGLIEDSVYAHMWLNIAASQGHEKARSNKEILIESMTRDEISKAQALARECVRQNYKNC